MNTRDSLALEAKASSEICQTTNKFLFNFAVSHSGGGFKRLFAYAKWFNENGGAMFIIHPRCERLLLEFPNNRFFIVNQPRYQRIYRDCTYLSRIDREVGRPDLYYSYGIPVNVRFGKLNWFHLSNLLPLDWRGIPLSLLDKLKFFSLGLRIRSCVKNADIISAESRYSLSRINVRPQEKLFLSVNGSDDELASLKDDKPLEKDNIAVILGTYKYKALEESYAVFDMLKKNNSGLKLMIIGDQKFIPKKLLFDTSVIVKGVLERRDVVACLRRARYYISTTYIENSYNAASEGVFFADESYISDIGPHRELMSNMHFERISVPNVGRPLLYIRKTDLSGRNLRAWSEVVGEMIDHIHARTQ